MTTFHIIFPLLCLALVGYVAVRTRFLEKHHIDGISKFAFYISIPALLFLGSAKADVSSAISWQVLVSFYLPVVLLFLGTYAWFKVVKGQAEGAVKALGHTYSNTILVALPIIMGVLNEAAIASVFVIISCHSAILFGLTYVLSDNIRSKRALFKTLLLNPIVISIGFGFAFNASELPLPQVVDDSLTMLSQPAIPCALFVLGANLYFYRIKGVLLPALSASLLKVGVLPAVVWWVSAHGFDLPHETVTLLVLLSAAPLGVNAYFIAQQVGHAQKLIASTVLMSTVLSILSYVFWLGVLVT